MLNAVQTSDVPNAYIVYNHPKGANGKAGAQACASDHPIYFDKYDKIMMLSPKHDVIMSEAQKPVVVDNKNQTVAYSALGLLGFGMTTVLLNIHNVGAYSNNSMIYSMGIFYGGLA